MLELREDTVIWAKNIFGPKVDRVGTSRTAPAFVPQKLKKQRNPRVAPNAACRPVSPKAPRVARHWVKRRKAGFSGTPEIEVSCVSPARKYDEWLQSCLYFTKFQESVSRAVLGGTRYPLYFKNWVFLRDFERGQNTAKLLPEVGILKILCPKLGRRGLSSRALNVPSKHDQKIQKKSFSYTSGAELFRDMAVWAKNIFCPKVDGLEQNLKAPPIGSKKMPKSAKLPMTQHPPPPSGIARRYFRRGGGHERGCCGDKPCENRGASRPICAREEQMKPYGTVRRAIFARPCAPTVAAVFP